MDIIVKNLGYFKLIDIRNNYIFYKTNKHTYIVLLDMDFEQIRLFRPLKDRLPFKIVKGKNICRAVKIKSSNIPNNVKQIIIYKEYVI